MRISLSVKAEKEVSPDFVNQIVRNGPLAEFYIIEEGDGIISDWAVFSAVSEVIRLEEAIKPSSPPDLDIRKINERIPEVYYCIHAFRPRSDNDFLLFDKTCSSMAETILLEVMVQPASQHTELDCQYREIVRLMAVNSYGRNEYITDSDQLNPFKELYALGRKEIRAKDPMADEFLRVHREFQRFLRKPQLLFSVKAWAERPETAHLIASAAAESAFSEGSYRIIDYNAADEWFHASIHASNELFPFADTCWRAFWDTHEDRGLFRLAHMTSVDEFKGMFRLPVAGYSPMRCLWKSTDYYRKMDSEGGLVIGHIQDMSGRSRSGDIEPESLSKYMNRCGPDEVPVNCTVDLLTKHMFIAGVPGSGKTTAIFNLLVQLFARGIPFLVIEPGKTEYRQLKMLRDHPDPTVRQMSDALRIYTPGKDEVSPFRFNPFEHPEGLTKDEHIAQILSCFEASIPLGGPLQALLAESVEAVYYEKEKKIGTKEMPVMSDLVQVAKRIMEGKRYVGEARANLSAAIEVRLSSLTRLGPGKIFQCRQSLPSIRELLKHPTIIEIQNLNAFQSCLLTLFLLSAIWEEIKISRRYSKGLKHLVVIEEAHNIVGRSDQAKPSEDFADPKAYAADYVVRMLAEIRAMGEGIIIADQLPSAVASSVVKNTGTKVAHRLVSLVDREDLGGAMLLQGSQTEEIARLEPGQAFYYTEGLYSPLQIGGLNANGFLGLGRKEWPDNAKILSVLSEETWFQELKKVRYSYVFKQFLEEHTKLKMDIDRRSGHLEDYHENLERIKNADHHPKDHDHLLCLRADVIRAKEDLKISFEAYLAFVFSVPKDFRAYLSEAENKKFKDLVGASIPLLKERICALEARLEHLRSEISEMI
jgi:hypothetical protein